MNDFGISDLSRSYALRGLNADLNRALVRLSEEVVTGRASDTTLRLNAQFSYLTQIETDLVQAEARSLALTEVAITADAQQTALGRVVEGANALFDTLAVAQNNLGALSVDSVASEARGILDTIVSSLNANQGGRYAFSGTQVDTPALAGTDQLLADFTAAISGAADEADLRALADDFFDLPGGGFETSVYQGTTQSLSPINLGNGETVALNLRADDQALRDMIKAVALIAVADDPALAVSDNVRQALVPGQTDAVLSARTSVLELSAQLGFSEERIDQSKTRLETERTSLEIARNDLVGLDAYDTAATLEAVRLQLETIYSVTARTQNLSLVNFL